MEHNNDLYNLRHSAAHLLAHAVTELYPTTKLTIGPVTDEGFFYDFLPEKNFKEEDLALIEAKMHEIAERKLPIIQKSISKEKALEIFKDNPFKKELIDAIPDKEVGLSCQGDFCDLCKGGHVESTEQLKHFKLLNISGSYWRADKNNQALQRITGTIFPTEQAMLAWEREKEEAAQADHRRIGKQQDLFSFNDVAAGFPIFHSKGLIIFNKLMESMREAQKGVYTEVKTPQIMSETLWKTSGHYDHYRDKMYFTNIDEQVHCIKPMSCPGGMLLFREKPRSYRELPMRLSEFGFVHRHELSGVLHGLFRVRAFTQDDAHIFCTPDQLESEIAQVIKLACDTYNRFGFNKVTMALATKPENAMGSDELWEKATNALRNALIVNNVPYTVREGDGAFYGPKVDMYIEDAMGRQWQCGTVQVDFFMPQKFNLTYVAADQSRQVPVVVHRAIYGSLERFMGVLLEHYKGNLPFWLTPVQVKLLTITDAQKEYARSIMAELDKHGIRTELDESSDPIAGQIKTAQQEKVPMMLVLGKKEMANNTVTIRHRDGTQEADISIETLLKKVTELNK
ncbi:MAG TPA: threonine--tRNA ligase [Candidatus Dependentiae bacterium]|jgi:threonyl-tRNA synthetase|nr:threonine--tRNA ligase [Candidatus Dependentiae bacterium]